jgi:tetratricopeptide (TPR) repeat protein
MPEHAPDLDLDAVLSLPQLLAVLDRLRTRAARGTGKARLSLSDLSGRSGVPRSTLASYLNGETLITADALDALVLALGEPADRARGWAVAWERATVGVPGTPGTGPAARARAGLPVPRQLPPDVAGFAGRRAELARLGGPLVLVTGPPGVGKSALAVHWAHRILSTHPDGQLHLNLRGYDPGRPLGPGPALEMLLRSLGADRVPDDVDAASALYRSLLAGRRMLVVLDNARSADQVRPLLPGAGDHTTIVTSRDTLPGLVARDGARRITLTGLDDAAAHELLGMVLPGVDRPTARRLLDRCGGLPLALRVAAERVAGAPPGDHAAVTAELTTTGLHGLAHDSDPSTDLRAVFSWSLQPLPADAARLFRLLGLIPGPTADAHAAAALTGTDVRHAGALLGALARASLTQPAAGGRHVLHDLLKEYAAELARTGPSDAGPARARLLDHYLRTAAAAMDAIAPHEHHLRPDLLAGSVTFDGPAAASGWLEVELPNLLAAADSTGDGHDGYVLHLSSILWRHLDTAGAWASGARLHERARRAARDRADPRSEALAGLFLSLAEHRLGRSAPAMSHALTALEAADDDVRHLVLTHLGVLHLDAGDPDRALEASRHAIELARSQRDRSTESLALANVAAAHEQLGDDTQALQVLERTRQIFEHVGNRAGVGHVLARQGRIHRRAGDDGRAQEHLERAVELFDQVGYDAGTAEALAALGRLHADHGDTDRARTCLDRAIALSRSLDQGR